MSQSILDRLMAPVKPRPITSFAPAPRQIDRDLWRLERKLRMPGGLVLPVGMTIIRLPSGRLLLHAPIRLDTVVEAALRGLGPIGAILAPNPFHHLFVSDYVRAFPGAALFSAPGLRERVPSLPESVTVGEAAPDAWEGAVDPVLFGTAATFCEVVIYHRSTSTLVLTDLAFHMRRYENTFDRIGWRLFGVPPVFGTSRTARFTLLRDQAAARPCLEKMLEKDFRRVLVAHGDPVDDRAREELHQAFRRYLERGVR